MSAEFDGESPQMKDVVVDFGGVSVVALALDAERAPFVVKNQVYGQPHGGAVSFEVPWREGTSVRSASRANLLRLLVPQGTLPTIDMIESSGWLRRRAEGNVSMGFTVTCYAVVPMGASVILPNHQAEATAFIDGVEGEVDLAVDFLAQKTSGLIWGRRSEPDSRIHTVLQGDEQIIIEGPGFFRWSVHADIPIVSTLAEVGKIAMRSTVRPAGIDRKIAIDVTNPTFKIDVSSQGDQSGEWQRTRPNVP
ncbi:hypothetical protein [Phytohabitans kaempferiae]|uniref:Uncharacterized protein n=1 Tax=Phytohabitans kaempferiae TaxID=1620943 RepID=A0ABV6MCM1_9ACTN